MKNQKSRNMVALKKIAIIPLLAAAPLSVKAQTNEHVTIWLNSIMDPLQVGNAIAQDPAFVTWHSDSILPITNPSELSGQASTTLELDEETEAAFANALAGAVSANTGTLFNAAVDSISRNVGTTTYTPDFGGAQRDSLASALTLGKVALGTYIGTTVPYNITADGKLAIAATNAALTLVTDAARYTMQEYLKTYLINKKGFTTTAASWTAYAAAQTFGVFMTPIWAYATQIGIAPHYNATTASRRLLITKLNVDANNYVKYSNNYNYYMGLYYQTNNVNYYNDAQQNLSSEQAYLTDYNNAKAKLALYDSVAFPALSTSTANQIHSLAIDPYPGYKNLATAPANYALMFDSIYNGLISKCDAVSDGVTQSVSITCPGTPQDATIYSRTRIYLQPLQQDANGNVTVKIFHVNGRGDAVLFGTYTINAKNINTANYH
ncbi:hypothetical protein [Ralstonia wenshanensis]|uniref:hypothetical protein n=1 Tax=Ralstonia wenshanensis TaxID=2842456 RepID=UPI003D953B2F